MKKNMMRILGGVLFGLAFLSAFFMYVRRFERPYARSQCLSNMKQLGTASLIYFADYDGHVMAPAWINELQPYLKHQPRTGEYTVHSCPDVTHKGKDGGYALDCDARGIEVAKVADPARTPLFFEIDLYRYDVVANFKSRSGRHNGGSTVTYLDSHGKYSKVGQ